MEKSKRNKAFTLAEVLITLGIIGVVAAMTIPTLMQKTDRRERVSAVKSAYSQLSQAVKTAMALNGNADKWVGVKNQDMFSNAEEYTQYGLAGTDWVGFKYILDEFKVIKVCPHSNECLAKKGETNEQSKKLYFLSGGSANLTTDNAVTAILANGMKIRIYNDNRVCSKDVRCFSFMFDISGNKTNHVSCKDDFEFNIMADRVNPRDASAEGAAEVDGRFNCTGYIIRNDNMDYLDNY